MTGIVWKAPPPGNREETTKFYNDIIGVLKSRPGEWALITTGLPSKEAKRDAFRRRGAKVAYRRDIAGTYSLYAKWPEEKA